MRAKYLSFLFLIASYLTGCNDQPTCIPEQSDLVMLTFTDALGVKKKITLISLTADNSTENFPVLKDTTESTFAIPLNPLDSSIIIRFEQATDTTYLALSYTTKLVILNPECILETKFENLKVDSTDFIDAIIIESLLSPEVTNNVEITH